jgi:hypothetical protein
MKRNILYVLSLLIFSWILLIFFSFIIALIISQVSELKGILARIIDLFTGLAIFIVWLLIWYLVVKKSFYERIKKFMNKIEFLQIFMAY